jgi:hypothetical protein
MALEPAFHACSIPFAKPFKFINIIHRADQYGTPVGITNIISTCMTLVEDAAFLGAHKRKRFESE